MKYLWLPLVLALPLATTQCKKMEQASSKVASAGDFTVAKSTFEGLTRGDLSVAKSIDWPMLKVLDQSVGAEYMQIPSETEKINFQHNFITNFASSFQQQGSTPASFTNWKVTGHDDLKTEVTADSTGGQVILTVSKRDGEERLSGIRMIK